jgi:hypothetical protein
MKKLSKVVFQEIKNWVYRNARPLDLALWQYNFENGSIDSVLAILRYYQNDDGGFGKTIDQDNWNPASTAYNAQIVIKMLRGFDFIDITHPIYKGIFNYLENTEYKSEHGWFFTIPSNNNFPHGIWWSYSPDDNMIQNVGTTASLCGFILRFGKQSSALYQLAKKYAVMLIERLKTETEHGDMGVAGYCELADDIEAAGLENENNYSLLLEKVPLLIKEKIHNEKENFMANPLEFITSPKSKYYDENKDEVEAALDSIIESRPENSVWDISWEWYNEYTATKNYAISENWWKSTKAIEKLLLLRNFGRLE